MDDWLVSSLTVGCIYLISIHLGFPTHNLCCQEKNTLKIEQGLQQVAQAKILTASVSLDRTSIPT